MRSILLVSVMLVSLTSGCARQQTALRQTPAPTRPLKPQKPILAEEPVIQPVGMSEPEPQLGIPIEEILEEPKQDYYDPWSEV